MNDIVFWMLGVWMPIIIIALIWSIVWKGMALWKAARHGDKGWFVVFLIVNTLGLLEIIYIYIFSKNGKETPIGNPPAKQKEKKA